MIIDITDHEKRVLASVGNGAYGRELQQILAKVTQQLCSLDSIDTSKDYTPQVEGRMLFKQFADELIRHLSFQKKIGENKVDRADYE